MAKQNGKTLDLVAACKALPRRKNGWKSAATQEQMEQMKALRDAYHRGEIVASIRHVHETIKTVLGLPICRTALGEWLNEGRPSKQA